MLRRSASDLEACERAARVRSRETGEEAIVFCKQDGGYGWSFVFIPEGAYVTARYRSGKRVSRGNGAEEVTE